MEMIKQWIMCITVSTVISGIVYLLSSDSFAEHAVKSIISVFMICAFLYPFMSGQTVDTEHFGFDFELYTDEISSGITDSVAETVKVCAEEKAREILHAIGAECIGVEAYTAVNENNEIYVDRFTVRLGESSREKESLIRDEIGKSFGAEAEIIWSGN